MNVAFLVGTITGGGAERVVSTLVSAFADMGHKAVLITFYKKNNEYQISEKVVRYSLRDDNYKMNKISGFIYTEKNLERICKNEEIDIMVSFMIGANNYNVIASKKMNIKSVISVRNDPEKTYKSILAKFIVTIIYPLADGCVFQTKDAKDWFPAKLQKKSEIICNPIHDDFYEVERKTIPYYIVTSGRLEKQKNHVMLIKSFEKVLRDFPDAKLCIFGEGTLREELQELIESLEMQSSVFLMGRTDKMAKELSKADLYVLSSDYEGMPNALMEAMAIGIPVIATDCPCGGPRWLLNEGENGILVPVQDKETLANEMCKLLNDDEQKTVFSYKAKQFAEIFKVYNVYDVWKRYLENVLNRNRR